MDAQKTIRRRRVVIAAALSLLAITAAWPLFRSSGGRTPTDPTPSPMVFDPLAAARASLGHVENLETPVPSACYAKTDGGRNSCWTCHSESVAPNHVGKDWELQLKYDFPAPALENHWTNLFQDRSEQVAALDDDDVLRYVRMDNYAPLRRALEARSDYAGYVPDLDFSRGFDEHGFANDGSGWRAVRWKPFPGGFWPTNGSAGDTMIRLPENFRQDRDGVDAPAVYRVNLAILEAAIGAAPGPIDRDVEPVDEHVAGADLDGNGTIGGVVSRIRTLPSHYAGGAHAVPVHRHLYPKGTEFLHSVRYLDPDAPTLMAQRMKELRYSRKYEWLDSKQLHALHNEEEATEEEGGGEPAEETGPEFGGTPETGLENGFGWRLQAFIEDRKGRLRLQTEEEHRFCMGCHGSMGSSVDYTFAFARKVPGSAGWRPQDIRGIPDVPQAGHAEPEVLTYFRRAGSGDDFGGNAEIAKRFFPGGKLDVATVRRAAPGGDQDIAFLIAPSRERALMLDKAYLVLVRNGLLVRGRDATFRPVSTVHPRVDKDTSTGLEKAGRVFKDGRAWLQWK